MRSDTSPSTHQDSPKASEQDWPWPTHTIARVLVKLARGPVVPGNYFYAIRFGDEPTDDEETYIPLSALLSDEVVEAVARAMVRRENERGDDLIVWDAGAGILLSDQSKDAWRGEARAALQAAIAAVSGGGGE